MKPDLNLVLGISGGIAAYKMPQLIRMLQAQHIAVKVVVTPHALPLVGEEALRTISKNPVFQDNTPSHYDMDHLRLAEWAQAMLICPATANTIAKIAHGIADNLLSTLALSFNNRLTIAPAMNSAMWEHPATRHNIKLLQQRGVTVLPVEKGELACGVYGEGRLLALNHIVDSITALMPARILLGKKVLIASGPTVEHLDPVRCLTNTSSGKMGAALAEAAIAMGATVTVVSGPANAPLPANARIIAVQSALEMQQALDHEFDHTDICIMAAAISDYRIAEPSLTKIARTDSKLTLSLVPNPDIAALLGARKKNQYLICFALDDSINVERARAKMVRKQCNMIVANSAAQALGSDSTQITIITELSEPIATPPLLKTAAARQILQAAAHDLGLDHA